MTVWSSQISPIILAVVLPSARVRRETFTRTSLRPSTSRLARHSGANQQVCFTLRLLLRTKP